MKIGELAERTGLTPSRIRYYEGIGILRSVSRLPNGYRVYGSDTVTELNLIVMAQKIGFTLDEIRQLVPRDGKGWNHALIEQTFERKIAAIEEQEARLAAGKARLIAVRNAVMARPADIDCAGNEARIVSLMARD